VERLKSKRRATVEDKVFFLSRSARIENHIFTLSPATAGHNGSFNKITKLSDNFRNKVQAVAFVKISYS